MPAIRVMRSGLHGFASLENGGDFEIDLPLDVSFERLVDAVISGIAHA